MAPVIPTVVVKAFWVLALIAASPASTGGVAGKFVVVIDACAADGKCEKFRWPVDVSSLVQCQRTGTFAIVGWGAEHPSYKLKSWRCAKADEVDL